MSHVAYDLQLADAMNDLQEQVKVENLPAELNEQGVENITTWPVDDVFHHLACLYIKYIEIFRKLEECYDQMVHPQKRVFIKKVLECTICRICEFKKDLVAFNTRPGSIYVHLDQLLFDLKYDPSVIEIPVPRYFREDDRIPVELQWHEKVEKADAKKKKGKKKKAKKKKKTDDDDEEKKKSPMRLEEKNQLMDNLFNQFTGSADPEIEVVQDPFTLDIDILQAIRIIQKNDRGRQGRLRIMMILKNLQKKQMNQKMMENIRLGKNKAAEQSKENQENDSCVFIQKRMNGILARKNVERLRTEEMEFLGMSRKKKTPDEERNDPVKKMEETLRERKLVQENNWKRYQDAKVEMKEEIEYNQGTDIMEDMLQQRRDWINEQKAMNGNKVPDDIKPFYDRFNTETPTSPEEEAAKAAEEAEEGGKKKKKGDKKAKKAKGKKSKKDDGDDKPQTIKIGTSEVVTKFDDFYDEWKNEWDQKDESSNQEQKHDEEKTRDDVMPSIEDQLKNDVDEMIKMELENMRTLSGVKAKKKKGKKKGKKKKKKKKKGPKLPGFKMIKDMNVKEILVTLINNNIVKKIPPQKLTDFMGEFNYIHTMLDDITKIPYDPSMALIRQLVTEYIIFPLGSELVRLRFPEDVSSFLFYGPAGTGKTLLVRAIVHETNSIFFDMSPINIDGKYTGKKEEEKLVASVFIVAAEYQPSVIYIDEAEKVWAAKKKGKKGKGAKKKKSDPSNPSRIKKAMLKWKAKFITDKTRITIIGCTSEPEEGSKKEFKKFFKRAIYFPFPDYSTRRLMWKNFIMTYKGQIRADFPLSTLAHISAGYSAGSIKKTCEKVLTEYRVKHQEQRPLSLPEFIGPLSLCSNTMDSQYAEFQEFTKNITGFKPPAEDGGEGGEKAPKKKKKKGK